ncbi:MAG: sel1 repeat family protein [Akkermansia sp.]|nr:sel1 repeat family protein [Akkermansia sp.]
MKHSPIAEYAGWLIPSVVAVCSVGVCLAQDSSSVAEVCHQGLEYFKIKEYEKAVSCFREAAEQGYADAQCGLGYCYALGEGVAQNQSEAVKWFRKAAEQGYAAAQYNLATCYAEGKGVVQDKEEAVKWFRKAAEQGMVEAEDRLRELEPPVSSFALSEELCNQGLKFYNSKEYEKAAECFRQAAEQGHAQAQFELGACYSLGKGVSEDSAEALKWFRKSAEQGHEYSCLMLGIYYECGKGGVDKDIAEAEKWYRRAAAHGNLKAYKKLEALRD